MTYDSLEKGLLQFLSGGKKTAILGIGNELRTDDGLGPYIISGLQISDPDLMIEDVGSVPEAFAKPVADFEAEKVILIDAANMGKPVGHIELVTKDRIGGIAISTHSMPLSLLMTYLEERSGAQTILLGVQPRNVSFGEGLTPDIQPVAERVIKILENVWNRTRR
ncbi:MAG: hydrogenase maturation peptidase HycI [Promethearchaeia archaeon]